VVRGVVVLAAAALASCAAYGRAPHLLSSQRGLSGSNEPLLRERPEPEIVEGSLELSYPVLVENYGPELARLYLSRAFGRVGDVEDTADSDCRVLYGQPRVDVSLPPGTRTRVDCRLRLTPLGVQRLAQGDVPLVLVIPAAQGSTPLALAFTYRLYEDEAP
jgi:hypothetical protein